VNRHASDSQPTSRVSRETCLRSLLASTAFPAVHWHRCHRSSQDCRGVSEFDFMARQAGMSTLDGVCFGVTTASCRHRNDLPSVTLEGPACRLHLPLMPFGTSAKLADLAGRAWSPSCDDLNASDTLNEGGYIVLKDMEFVPRSRPSCSCSAACGGARARNRGAVSRTQRVFDDGEIARACRSGAGRRSSSTSTASLSTSTKKSQNKAPHPTVSAGRVLVGGIFLPEAPAGGFVFRPLRRLARRPSVVAKWPPLVGAAGAVGTR
jgi:hypothetical protein